MNPSIWVATSPLVEQASFHRQNFAVVGTLTPEIFARGYSVAASLSAGVEPDKADFDRAFSFYHVRTSRLLRCGESIDSQGVKDNDVLVLLPGDDEQAGTLAAMIEQTQGFPPQITNLPPHVGSVTMHDIEQRGHSSASSAVTNTVSIHVGAGATFTGPIALGREIQQAFTSAHEASAEPLRERLEELVKQVTALIQEIPDDDLKNEAAQHLTTFVEQAKKERPSKQLIKVTADGLIEAAKSVAAFAAPVAETVRTIISVLGVAG